MNFKSFGYQNYKAFSKLASIDLRPLTLLFGYNSAGKSAILRGLVLLSSSLRGTSSEPLDLRSPSLRNCRFTNLINNGNTQPSGLLTIQVEAEEDRRLVKFEWIIRNIPEFQQQVIGEFSILDNATGDQINGKWIPDTGMDGVLKQDYVLAWNRTSVGIHRIPFRGLTLTSDSWPIQEFDELKTTQPNLFRFLSHLFTLRTTETELQWLTSVRCAPPRIAQFPGVKPVALTGDGGNALEILAYDKLAKGLLVKDVSQWYEHNLNQKFNIQLSGEQYQGLLEPLSKSPFQVNIADVGEGLIQVFPILVGTSMLSLNYNGKRILAIEEPESHLHPKLHPALAARFCAIAAANTSNRILLETHSENLLLATQIQIAEGKISAEDVIVYWIRQIENGSSAIEKVTFEPNGRPNGNIPAGVFSTGLEQARTLLSKQLGIPLT